MVAYRRPVATYRVQLHAGFGFCAAAGVIDYLRDLGITDLYCSPILKARPGSMHGYDIVDPTALNPELGEDRDFESLVEKLRSRDMGLLLDIVPNHLAISSDNPAWMDVLKRGRESKYARWFDIHWDDSGGRLVLPLLGASLDEVITAGEISVEMSGDAPAVRYHEWTFPLSDATRSEAHPAMSGNALKNLLEKQHYALCDWKTALEQLTYRRFFDITHLIGVRVEDPAVFDATHERVLDLVRCGRITGLRIDHIDGLADPQAYLERLQQAIGAPDRFYIIVEKILEADEPLHERWPVSGTTGYEFLNALNTIFVDRRGLAALTGFHTRLAGTPRDFGETVYEQKRRIASELFAGELASLADQLAAMAKHDGVVVSRSDLEAAIVELSARLPVYRTYLYEGEASEHDYETLEECFAAARDLQSGHQEAIAYVERILLDELPPATPHPQAAARRRFITEWQQFTGPLMAKGFEDTALYRDVRLISLNEVGADAESFTEPGDVERFHECNIMRRRDWPHSLSATSTHDAKRSEDVRCRIHVLSEIAEEWIETAQRWLRYNEPLRAEVDGNDAPSVRMELMIYQSMLGAWPLHAHEDKAFRTRLQEYAVKAAREAKGYTGWIEMNEPYEQAVVQFIGDVLDPARDDAFTAELRALRERLAWYGALNSLSQTLLKICSPGAPDFYQGCELWDFSLVDPDNRRPVDFDLRRRMLASLPSADVGDLLTNWRDGRIKLLMTQRGLTFRRDHAEVFLSGEYIPLRVHGERAKHVCAFARRLDSQWMIAAAPLFFSTLALPEQPPLGEGVWGDTVLQLPRDAPHRWQNVLSGEVVAAGVPGGGAAGSTSRSRHLPLHDVFATLPSGLLSAE